MQVSSASFAGWYFDVVAFDDRLMLSFAAVMNADADGCSKALSMRRKAAIMHDMI